MTSVWFGWILWLDHEAIIITDPFWWCGYRVCRIHKEDWQVYWGGSFHTKITVELPINVCLILTDLRVVLCILYHPFIQYIYVCVTSLLCLGPLTGTAVDVYNAWVKVGKGGHPDWPDIQLLFHTYHLASDYGTFHSAVYNFDQQVRFWLTYS